MEAEIWKSIINYEGLYEVSNLGNVRSMEHIIKCKGGHYEYQHRKMKILKPVPNTNKQKKSNTSYLRVRLYKDGKWTSFFVHRLVAQAFVPNPANKKEVNHKDGNRHNNNADNLEWATQSENTLHRIYTLNQSTGNQMELVPVRCVETGEEYTSLSEAARAIGTRVSNIWNSIENGREANELHFERIKK